jgi:hypothetical protein
LGKGWNRVNIWEDMGVKAWVEYLTGNEIQGFPPGYALEQQFVLPFEYFRNEDDMEDWEDEVIEQEKFIAEGREALKFGGETHSSRDWKRVMAKYFRKQTSACDWPTKCSFQEVCFGPKAYLHDPISSGLYQIRVPNHKTELNP